MTNGTMMESKWWTRRRITGSCKQALRFTFDNNLRLDISR